MKYLKLVLIFFLIGSCKGQNDVSSFNTTWYEVKKQGNEYVIIKCGYDGEWLEIQHDSIFDHGTMEENKFKIHHVIQNENSTFLYINENEKYNISWINKKQGIAKVINDNNTKYYVNKPNLNNIKKLKGTNKDCISVEDFENPQKIVSTEESYSIDGIWKLNCEDGIGSISIKNNEASLVVLFNQIYIHLIEIKRYDFEQGIAYKLKEIPEDSGSFGAQLPWKDYLNDKPICYIKKKGDNIYWYGFYNKKTKKREITDSEFNQENNNKEVILKKCHD
ncbi:hypothetical protein [Chryseobacterium luteum]|uniref:Lipoprotein n=1 Tax=Chryseobacterium luteum TaxID=421531 RepID=A0A085YXN8_9FLAO|nr:hypothetical protein [Chryseobacterium luteum]KFE96951.1 hypothetical protein IX38_22370 [Chryseobacterium luteum]